MELLPTPDFEPKPKILEEKPELELAWRGLAYSIKANQIDRERAEALLQEWAESKK